MSWEIAHGHSRAGSCNRILCCPLVSYVSFHRFLPPSTQQRRHYPSVPRSVNICLRVLPSLTHTCTHLFFAVQCSIMVPSFVARTSRIFDPIQKLVARIGIRSEDEERRRDKSTTSTDSVSITSGKEDALERPIGYNALSKVLTTRTI
ncbi:uncharacterized protein LOC105699673 [Orussus abietinus]|uniref:uncharacterized protein LOC105699673 n=1 Tax=Orussus abietinus TaxID=222816 RepID=UPI000C7161B2|nr:uncharacterized protein LOC105699673 [Orussus abietinus]